MALSNGDGAADVAADAIQKAKGRKGRVNPDKQEAVLDSGGIRAKLPELERAYLRHQEAATEYGDMVKAAAERSGYKTGPLRRFLNARMKDKLLDVERDNDQFTQLMLDLGEKA